MKSTYLLLSLVILSSCIPISIKPNIEDYKLTNGAKFKRGLPNQETFIFEDPKDADEFYTYINVKFNRQHQDVQYNVPVDINGTEYYLTFYETERSTKTINLLPIVADAALLASDLTVGDTFIDSYTSRSGQWYLIITVNNNDLQDALSSSSPDKNKILQFLRKMKQEYLATANYQEIYFKNPPVK